MHHVTIAIDGPAGAGKSTVAKEVARRLGFLYVDTGAMYRSVAWLAVTEGVDVTREERVISLLNNHQITFQRDSAQGLTVYVDGHDITSQLRTPEVSNSVSQLSVYPSVRQQLTDWQRDFANRYSVVMDGRDIGTVVVPQASLKIFLTASLEERARRRADEFAKKGFETSAKDLERAISERDARDSSREVAPMKPAEDAYTIDSTGKSIAQVVDEILALVGQVTA